MDLELEIIRQPISPYFLESNKTFEYFVIFFFKLQSYVQLKYTFCVHILFTLKDKDHSWKRFLERERERERKQRQEAEKGDNVKI